MNQAWLSSHLQSQVDCRIEFLPRGLMLKVDWTTAVQNVLQRTILLDGLQAAVEGVDQRLVVVNLL